MNKNSTILKINGLQVKYGSKVPKIAVDDVDLEIGRGEIVVITGETGCGKSSLARACINLLHGNEVSCSGQILYAAKNGDVHELIDRSDSTDVRFRGSHIGMVFQEPVVHLNPTMKIKNQLLESLSLNEKISSENFDQTISQHLELLGLERDKIRILNSYPGELSGGECQRLFLAMTALQMPQLLIADEPTSAVDSNNTGSVLDYMKQLQSDWNMSILLITHDLDIGLRIADKVGIMQHGKIVEYDAPHQILENPNEEYSKYLVKQWKLLQTPHTKSTDKKKGSETSVILDSVSVSYHKSGWKGLILNDQHIVLDRISFNIHQGEILGVVGMSGSGKSTLAKCISGILPLSTGSLIFNHQSKHRKVQMVFQQPAQALSPKQMIGNGLLEIINAQIKTTQQRARKRAGELLKMVHLDQDYFNRLPRQLSGGEKQRICIARALASNPEIIIFDEATSSLDAPVKVEILELLISLNHKLNLTCILISHDFSVIKFVADKIMVMHEGKIIEHKNKEDLISRPEHPITKQLIHASPLHNNH